MEKIILEKKKYYIDTCIWRDYFEDRQDKLRPLGEWAFRLIQKIITEEGIFIISELIIEELKQSYSVQEISRVFRMIPVGLIQELQFKETQKREAIRLNKELQIPFKDALHAVMAKDNNATLITRDKHFLEITNYVTINKPEELL